ncbi:MAG: hypothetical protein U5R06_02100 [candidate division KSB1 bacterium]|nr:hypothetical protein [candidate division KSB1 bacterium]
MMRFEHLSSEKANELISAAKERVIYIAPSLKKPVANGLVAAVQNLSPAQVLVIVDNNEHVYRMGYGDIEAMNRVFQSPITVQHKSGLRVGLLVVDNRAWSFTPTALYIEQETQSDQTPNAIRIDRIFDLKKKLDGVLPDPFDSTVLPVGATDSDAKNELASIADHINASPVQEQDLKNVQQSLEQAPPLPFNVCRQVQVFQPYIQYVQISLTGCAINRKRINIPGKIQNIGSSSLLQERLNTTVDLIDKNSKLSSKSIEESLKNIRDTYTQSLGDPWGRVVLRSKKHLLEEKLSELEQKIKEFKGRVRNELETELKRSFDEIINYYAPIIMNDPPAAFKVQIIQEINLETAKKYVSTVLEKTFPKADSLISDMKLQVQYRDVTYETLNQNKFAKALQKAYPIINWEKPFNEFQALPQTTQQASFLDKTDKS